MIINNMKVKRIIFYLTIVLLIGCKGASIITKKQDLNSEILPQSLTHFKLNDKDEYQLINSAIKKDYNIFFRGTILSFDTILIGKGKKEYLSSYIEINHDSLIINKMTHNKSKEAYKHNLTLKKAISINIERKLNSTIITIVNENEAFKIETNFFIGMKKPFVRSLGSVIDVDEFKFTCNDYQSDIALFGDSYVNCGSPQRWPYYVYNKKYQFFCDGLPGSKSIDSYDFIKSSFSVYKPKYVIWCLGMNDESDKNNVVDPDWKYYTQKVIDLCHENNVTLILATIPSVPTRNHIEKNKFVRASGYRYIDFDKKVSDGKGNWEEALLAKDGVHPTKKGAEVLAEAFIDGFSEIKQYLNYRTIQE